MKQVAVSAVLAASLLSTSSLAADCANVLTPDYETPELADGWSAQLIVKDLKKPRTIEFDTDGNLIVVESGKGISRIRLKDNGGTCLEVDKSVLLIDNENLNHGLAFSDDCKTLYASTVSTVYSWSYDSKTGTVSSEATEVITNMANNALVTRTLLMSKKSPGSLLVSRGADENNDADATDISTGLSQIRVFNLTSPPESGTFNYNTDGKVLGWGLRNAVGLAEHPSSGGIWSVDASVDDITRDGTDIHQNNPAEELNYHGPLSDSADIANYEGPNYGYPVCYALWDPDIPKAGDLGIGDQFSMESANDSACADDYEAPRLVFQAHTSPLNLLFSEDGGEAYFAFHGSFNRDNPVGYTLSLASFDGSTGQPSSAASDSRDALADVMRNPTQSECPDNCFRPVGLAWDSQGRLWMTSDSTGEIYVLQKGGSSGSGSGSGSDNSNDENVGSRDGVASVKAVIFASAAAVLTAVLML